MGLNSALEKEALKALEDLLQEQISTDQECLPSYVKDTTDVLKRIDGVSLDVDMILVTADIESLYTSIRHSDGLQAGTEMQLIQFMQGLNTNDLNIKLTYVFDKHRVEFLDIVIEADDMGCLQTDVFRKKTSVNALLHATSAHNQSTIGTVPTGQFLRMRRICSSNVSFEKQSSDLRERFLDRGKFPFNPKLGIDNPALCLGEDPGTNPEPAVRVCVLRKYSNCTFGFHLRMEIERDGHVIRQVVPGEPADLAGLKDGDQVLQINGEYVHEQVHIRVVQKVKASGSRLSLTVLDEASYENLQTNKISPISILTNYIPESCPRPRLCLVRNTGKGLGFTASATGGVRGTFLLAIEDGGAAQKAGIPQGARLLEVNGESIGSFTMSQLTKTIQHSGSPVVLLVLESSAWGEYESRGVTPSIAFADTSSLPYQPRKLHLVRCPQGYGFLLRQEKCLGGQGQFLCELDPGLPAEVAGMHEGDRLLGVNGQSVEGLEHEDIVSLIQESGKQVTLLVISNEGDRFYSEIGTSPLLFYEDKSEEKVSEVDKSIPIESPTPSATKVEETLYAQTEKEHEAAKSSEE
ncbi:Na(+)/H(+) exchange regulatory cofactor NHE-RF4 [Rhinoderma darwinii]|uniref:Na(+)/H(+) exchange regulatory cofactor NHE-RF4 n=1 Tax=Rhinoderma darwinii TaxID=43563 RepID=UPI003F67F47D